MRKITASLLWLQPVALGLALTAPCAGAEWKVSAIALPADARHPIIACTPAELDRLRAAYRGTGPEHDAVAAVVSRAARCVDRPVAFPPRGGQHNQWYQCDKCQIALRTIDDGHHQCPRCKTTYTGEPYDDVIFARKHGENLHNMNTAAWAYAITGQAKYAEYAKAVLLGYAQRYKTYPYHDSSRKTGRSASRSGGHLDEQTLNEAASMAGAIAPAYDLIHDSGVLSAADREAIRTGLLVPMLENIDKHKAGKGNWQTWHNAAMLSAAPLVGDAAWLRKAIAAPGNGFVSQMEASVSEDGMWYENSWGYHFYTLRAMVHIVEGARRLGIDLWSHPALKKMFTLPVEYAMPDGSLPRFGDDVHTTINHASTYLEYAYHAYREPAMLPHLPRRPTWDSVMLGRAAERRPDVPPPESKVFRASGHAVLRAGGDAGPAAVMTFGPYGGFHGHFDKLSFVFFAYGQELGVDPGRAKSQAYRLPIHTRWYKATLSHNTVLVDQAPQKPAAGALKFFAASAGFAAAVARCDEAYPGTAHRRMVCTTPRYLLVFDELKSSAQRRFDWVYHSRGTGVLCDAARRKEKLGETYPGQEYVENIKAGTTAEPIRVQFPGPAVTTHLAISAGPETEVRIGDGVGESVVDRVPMVMVTRRGAEARFAAVLEPVVKDGAPAIRAVRLDPAEGSTQVTVEHAAGSDVFALSRDGTVSIKAGGKTILGGPSSAMPADSGGRPALVQTAGDWQVRVTAQSASGDGATKASRVTATLPVAPATVLAVSAEKYDALPPFRPEAGGGWQKGVPLRGVQAQECTNRGLLDPGSLQVRDGPGSDSLLFELGKDYAADLEWGTVGRLPGGRIREGQAVYASYRCGQLRIDAVVFSREGQIVLRQGRPHPAAPLPPKLDPGERRLANIWLPGRIAKLGSDHLFPVLETAYPEPPKPSPSVAERLLPKTLKKLREGQSVRVLAWGDSVTDGGYLPDAGRERWQAQFAARLRERFPRARVELVTEAWGGRNTASYLAEPPGSDHNYKEKVLDARPDLIVSEFVNDAGLSPQQVEERYGKLLEDFRKIGAEWIPLTPHYVRGDWMGLARERDIDDDPRPYVAGLRRFAAEHQVALADASLRWGRLWRQGIPYTSLLLNSINHPDARGMKLFADSLMALFP